MADSNEELDNSLQMDSESLVSGMENLLGKTQEIVVNTETPAIEVDENGEPKKPETAKPEELQNIVAPQTIENENDDDSPFNILTEMLKGEVFDDSDLENEQFKFDGTKESFIKAIDNSAERRAEGILDEMIKAMPPKLKAQVSSFLEGLEEEQALTYGDKLSKYESMTDEVLSSDENKAEEVYTEYLKSKGFSETKIQKLVKQAKELDELADEAKEAKTELVKEIKAKAKADADAAEAKRVKDEEIAKNRVENLKKDIMGRKEIIPGVPLTDTMKKKVIENVLNPVAKDENGNPINKMQSLFKMNPTETAILFNTYIELGLFNYDSKTGKYVPDLSKVTNYKKTNVVDDVVDKLKHSTSRYKGGSSNAGNNLSLDASSKSTLSAIKQLFKEEQ